MYFNACLLYEDIEGDLRQEKAGLYLTLRSPQLDMSLCFSYSQLKTLVDGCNAMLGKANLPHLAESEAKDLTGALSLAFALPEETETAPRQGLGFVTKTA